MVPRAIPYVSANLHDGGNMTKMDAYLTRLRSFCEGEIPLFSSPKLENVVYEDSVVVERPFFKIIRTPGTNGFEIAQSKSVPRNLDTAITVAASFALLGYTFSIDEIIKRELIAWTPDKPYLHRRGFNNERELGHFLDTLSSGEDIVGVRSFHSSWLASINNQYYLQNEREEKQKPDYIVIDGMAYFEVNPSDKTDIRFLLREPMVHQPLPKPICRRLGFNGQEVLRLFQVKQKCF